MLSGLAHTHTRTQLYAPEELQRTKEEARQKRAKEKAELYSVRRDPHLQEYWRAKHLLDTTATTTASRRAARIAERRQRLEHEQHATTGTPPPQHLPPLKAGPRRRHHPDSPAHGPVASSSLSYSSESSSGGADAAPAAGRNATGEKTRVVEEIDGAPMCEAAEEEEEEAASSDELAAATAGGGTVSAGGPAGAPAEDTQDGEGAGGVVPSGVLKSDLTALSIMLDPPVHFQSRVHRLQLSTGCYDVGWVRRFRGDDALGPGVEAQLAGMRLLTLDDIPVHPSDMPRFLERQKAYLSEKARRAARPTGITALQHFNSPTKSSSPQATTTAGGTAQQQQQHPSVLSDGLPTAPVVLSSPRSALCALRRGVPPAELLPRPLAYFEKQVGLEGAPAHVVERRYKHFEAERGALLTMLLTSYHEICASLTLVQCLRLLKAFNPEHNFDVALQEDLRDAAHFVSTLPAEEGGGGGGGGEGGGGAQANGGGSGGGGEPAAVRCFSDVSDEEDSGGGGGGGQREASPQRAGETGALTTQDGGGGSSGCTAVSTTAGMGTGAAGANESKEFRLREKCRTALDRAKEKMQVCKGGGGLLTFAHVVLFFSPPLSNNCRCHHPQKKPPTAVQGHLVRTILLKRVTQKKADERSEKVGFFYSSSFFIRLSSFSFVLSFDYYSFQKSNNNDNNNNNNCTLAQAKLYYINATTNKQTHNTPSPDDGPAAEVQRGEEQAARGATRGRPQEGRSVQARRLREQGHRGGQVPGAHLPPGGRHPAPPRG